MKIKVIASHPKDGQDPIENLIGKEFETVGPVDEDGSVSVNTTEFGGLIVLQPSEFERMTHPKNLSIG